MILLKSKLAAMFLALAAAKTPPRRKFTDERKARKRTKERPR